MQRVEPDASDRVRYGFYLRPDPATCRAVAEMHALLKAQYGVEVAGRFSPHITIKGFFRSDASPSDMAAALDRSLAGYRPFRAWHCGLAAFSATSLVLRWNELPDGSPNPGFFEVQERAFAALAPLIHPACEWTPRDPRGPSGSNPLHAHLTLAMQDLPAGLREEVREFIESFGRIGSESFLAETYQLFRFQANWAGDCWSTLSWQILHSWRFRD